MCLKKKAATWRRRSWPPGAWSGGGGPAHKRQKVEAGDSSSIIMRLVGRLLHTGCPKKTFWIDQSPPPTPISLSMHGGRSSRGRRRDLVSSESHFFWNILYITFDWIEQNRYDQLDLHQVDHLHLVRPPRLRRRRAWVQPVRQGGEGEQPVAYIFLANLA